MTSNYHTRLIGSSFLTTSNSVVYLFAYFQFQSNGKLNIGRRDGKSYNIIIAAVVRSLKRSEYAFILQNQCDCLAVSSTLVVLICPPPLGRAPSGIGCLQHLPGSNTRPDT